MTVVTVNPEAKMRRARQKSSLVKLTLKASADSYKLLTYYAAII